MFFRPLQEQDLSWLWAAYHEGFWSEVLQAGLSADAFEVAVTELISLFDKDWLAQAQTPQGLKPMGVIVGNYRLGNKVIEPHIDWFSWTPPRVKLEVIGQFLMEEGKRHKIFVYAREDKDFWSLVHKYKVIDRGCKINDCYGRGDDVMFYYTAGPF